MQLDDARNAPIAIAPRGRHMASTFEDVVPRLGEYAETAALYLVICAFWGLVFFVSLTSVIR
jgi:hypothetical protein